MVDPKSTFSKILSDLEREIKDKHDLEIAKNKLLEASMMFIDITNRVAQSNSQYDILSNKIDAMQKSLRKIEEDIYIDESEDNEESEYNLGDQMHDNDINEDEFEFEIKCPYCNYEFVVGQDADLKEEIECPKCHKEIELDWDDYCDGECEHCKSICYDGDLEKDLNNEQNKSLEDIKNLSEELLSNSIKEDEEKYNANENISNNNSQNKDSNAKNNNSNLNHKKIDESNRINQNGSNNQVNENEDDM